MLQLQPAPQVMEFYGLCSHANNYASREATCACLAELAERLEPAAVQPHLPAILRLLLSLLRDDSWPVSFQSSARLTPTRQGQACRACAPAQCAALPVLHAAPAALSCWDPQDLLRQVKLRHPLGCAGLQSEVSCTQVRASACLASGQTVRAHPDQSRGALPRLHATWAKLLDDNVFSVREGAAVALGHAAAAFGGEELEAVLALLRFAFALF